MAAATQIFCASGPIRSGHLFCSKTDAPWSNLLDKATLGASSYTNEVSYNIVFTSSLLSHNMVVTLMGWHMKTSIRKMGNSQGVLIPKPFLAQTGMDVGEVDIEIESDAIVIRKLKKKARQGWAEASKAIAAAGDDGLVWPELANEDDKELVW